MEEKKKVERPTDTVEVTLAKKCKKQPAGAKVKVSRQTAEVLKKRGFIK